ncbi:lysylphosphatidylglycerol synthase domain-containing protein [Mycoplasmopsis caviae]|uniref:Lysylphosphatidylglycerol synthase domain-containing protein n=1 Tax=Mycoplasmopsis caviae TaxID=55603 RepID=A0A3P8MDR6_9BACT|nr:lysylphosphatidylglycerol synthase domain-containing protein [Mycoplasmopsis caviae]UUD35023.1 lysylphosphatidylglycerol synthase domain-containing protein [Mycoplasmopsis caviae]VDR42150.1 Uncharacterised protein [Mycoplasmopsis caviae]
MANNPILNKWNKNSSDDDEFVKKLLTFGLKKEKQDIDSAFSRPLRFISNKVIAKLGVGSHLINDYTVTALGHAFCDVMNEVHKQNSEFRIFLVNDNSFHSLLYINILARIFDEKGFKSHIFEKNGSYPSVLKNLAAKEDNCQAIISIENFKGLKNIMQISFNWGDGRPFNHVDVARILFKLNSVNYLNLDIPNQGISFRYNHSPLDYSKEIYKRYLPLFKDLKDKDLKFGIDISQISTTNFYLDILKRLHIEYVDTNRKKDAFNINADNPDCLRRIYWKTLFKKTNANFSISHDGSGVNLSIRHKKVFKYFKPDEIAALYLNFLLEDDQTFDKTNLTNSYIIKSLGVGTLTSQIALKHNIHVEETSKVSEIWEISKRNSDKNLIFAFTRFSQFSPFNRLFNGFDANLFMLELIRMIIFYKDKNLSLYDVLQKIYDNYGLHHVVSKNFTLDDEMASRFIKRIIKSEAIGNHKIVNLKEYKNTAIVNNNVHLKLYFEGGNSLTVKYSIMEKEFSVDCEVVAKSNTQDDHTKLIILERELMDGILELKEDFKIRKVTPWTFIKWFIFISMFIGVIVFLYFTIYNFKDDNFFGTNGNIGEMFRIMWIVIFENNKTRISFLTIALSFFIWALFNTIIFKRLLDFQGQKVRWNDIIISSLIATIVQNVTPKSIGGDLATYWYLRRKGIKRPVLLPAIVTNTFLWQVGNIFTTLLFLPFGIWFYQDLLSNISNPQVKIFYVFFIIGLITDSTFAALFFALAFNKKIQNWLLKIFIGFLEWLPFVKIYDPLLVKAKHEYEFYEMRQGMKKTFRKWYQFGEVFIWKMLPTFLSPMALFMKATGTLKPDLTGGWYFNVLVSNTLIKIGNSVSITPGGQGTNELFTNLIYNSIMKERIWNFKGEKISLSSIGSAKLMTSIGSIWGTVLGSIISAIFLILVFIGEKRVDVYQTKEKNLRLIQNDNVSITTRTKTRFYKISFTIYAIIILALSILVLCPLLGSYA